MDTPSGIKDSIPAWIKYSVQAPGEIPYDGIYYDPPEEVFLSHILYLQILNIPLFLLWASNLFLGKYRLFHSGISLHPLWILGIEFHSNNSNLGKDQLS
jgi:hypothetical protein